jgi:hypothetical protein
MLPRLLLPELRRRLTQYPAGMIGVSRRLLVSQTPRSSGDDVLASCNLVGLIDRLRR